MLNSNVINGAIPNVFGTGILGTAVTGLFRIPAFMANCTAVMMVGELAIRGLTNTISVLGFEPKEDFWVSKFAENLNNSGVRPYKNDSFNSLAVKAVAFAALGIIGSEFARVAGGQAPGVYNVVLAFLGPIRISNASYLDGIRPLIGRVFG